jgi:hypothetical protein
MSTETTLSPMRKVAEASAEWRGHGLLKRAYELRSETAVFATLEWQSALGSLAQARTHDATWTLKRIGFFRPSVSVRVPDSETDLVVYHPVAGRRARRVRNAGVELEVPELGARATASTMPGAPCRVHANTLKIPPSAGLVVAPAARELDEVPLRVVLGWYISILAFDDMAGAGAAAAAAG